MKNKQKQLLILIVLTVILIVLAYLNIISYLLAIWGLCAIRSIIYFLDLYSKYKLTKNKNLLFFVSIDLVILILLLIYIIIK